MSKNPFMPLWVADFLGDTLDLDAKEIGAYMLILMSLWTRGGTLPNDPAKLKRVARVGRDWPRIWDAIERYFIIENGVISNGRLSQELHKVDTKRRINAHSGARGGRAKALKDKERALANATVSLQQPEPYLESKRDVTDVTSLFSDAESGLDPPKANDLSKAVARYNDAAAKAPWPSVHKLNPKRSKLLRARLLECGGLDGWEVALRKAFDSDFCWGRTSRPFLGFCFDWMIKSDNFTKIMEGNYDNRDFNAGRRSSARPDNRPDPAIDQIARLAGLGEASGADRG